MTMCDLPGTKHAPWPRGREPWSQGEDAGLLFAFCSLSGLRCTSKGEAGNSKRLLAWPATVASVPA